MRVTWARADDSLPRVGTSESGGNDVELAPGALILSGHLNESRKIAMMVSQVVLLPQRRGRVL